MGIVGSVISLIIVCILRLIAESLLPNFAWLAKYTPYVNYAIYALVGVVALFVLLAVVRAILTVGKK